jgi:hypothetical protein
MSRLPVATTLAGALDRTRWDYAPEKDRRFLLDPIGEIFAKLPWEARAYHLGPLPVHLRLATVRTEGDEPEVSSRRRERA